MSDTVITTKQSPKIPDHELIRCIGKGSYGEVWLARNVMGTYRAVKIVYRKSFDNDRPFEREFKGIQKFEPISRSDNSQVDILHIGRGDDYFYYVMELADDQTRGQQIDPDTYVAKNLWNELNQRGRLPFAECLEIGLALTAALDHLHKNGLVHRDVKPSNVIFINGIPKLADIGLVTDVAATMSYVGTEGFFPPEGPGTPQADIYSLGKVLYEISTGKDRHDFPEPPTLLGEFADRENYLEFSEIVKRACETHPEKRYRTAEAMRSDLVLLKGGRSVRQANRRKGWATRAVRFALASAVIAAVLWTIHSHNSKESRMLGERRTRMAQLHDLAVFGQEAWRYLPYLKRTALGQSKFAEHLPTHVVANLNDTGPGSLRQTIADASPGDLIAFKPGLAGTLILTNSELSISCDLAIVGPSDAKIVLNGNHSHRVLRIARGGLFLSNLTVSNGFSDWQGAGIWCEKEGALVLNSCTVCNNETREAGGGLANNGKITIINSTFSGNKARDAGGLYNYSGTMRLSSCTIVSNSASQWAGGMYHFRVDYTLELLENTIIAGNTAGKGAPDVLHDFSDEGYNIIGVTNQSQGFYHPKSHFGSVTAPLNPMLGPLQDNGGPTCTHRPLPGSPAIGAGKAFGIRWDQRGELRNVPRNTALKGDSTSIGAVEFQKTENHDALVREQSIQRASQTDQLSLLAIQLKEKGNLGRAESTLRKAISLEKESPGGQRLALADYLQQLGVVLESEGKFDEAEAATRDSMEVTKNVLGGECPELAEAIQNLSRLVGRRNRPEEAKRLNDEKTEIDRQWDLRCWRMAGNPDNLTISMVAVINTLLIEKKFSEAESLTRECLAIREERHPGDWSVFSARSLLAASLLCQKRYPQAEQLLLAAYDGLKHEEQKIPAVAKGCVYETVQRLIDLYAATGQSQQCAEWKNKLLPRN